VQELLGIEVLTVIPHLSRKQRTRSIEDVPALIEGCRMLSASLNAAQTVEPFKLLMITSTLSGEGKSTIAVNLATFLAMEGKRVLLVDANLRNPALDQHFQLDKLVEPASAFMRTWTKIEGDLNGQQTDVANLHVLTAGALISNSTDLLQPPWADRFFEHLKKVPFDYIIFDTPPLLPVADTQILASYVQMAVLVVDASKTSRKELLRVKQILRRLHTTLLGAVLNKSRWPVPGEIRRYLKNTRPRQADIAMAMTMPQKAASLTSSPDMPSVNGAVDPDATVTLPRQPWPRDEKS